MSKADRLGRSTSFARATPISARRAAISQATGAPTEGAAPPHVLPIARISFNPDNPRESFGDVSELGASLRDHGQKQACSVMSRGAYLAANPGRADDLAPDTDYVVVDGNRRLAAAHEAGLTVLKVTVDDDLGSTPDEILESSLVANIHREAFEPLDEARALQKLLDIHGTQEKLAQRLHRSQGWISQRLALLNLTPELQERLEAGQEPVELLRRVGNKPQDVQEQQLQQLKEERGRKRESKRQRRQAPPAAAPGEGSGSPSHYGVIIGSTGPEADAPSEPAGEGLHYGVMKPAAAAPDLPWDSPAALDAILREHMTAENRLALAELLLEDGPTVVPQRATSADAAAR